MGGYVSSAAGPHSRASASLAAIIASVAFLLMSCGRTHRTGLGSAPPTFTHHVAPVFAAHCAMNGCHAPPVSAHLDLRPSDAYEQIVAMASVEDTTMVRIDPWRPDSSYLLRKVSECPEGGCYFGHRMPAADRAPLTPAQIAVLRRWIEAGAPR
jgi:hypothetical protein